MLANDEDVHMLTHFRTHKITSQILRHTPLLTVLTAHQENPEWLRASWSSWSFLHAWQSSYSEFQQEKYFFQDTLRQLRTKFCKKYVKTYLVRENDGLRILM
jgi:hypothetical protein